MLEKCRMISPLGLNFNYAISITFSVGRLPTLSLFFIVREKVDVESQTSGKSALEKSKCNLCSPFSCQMVAKLLNKWSRNHDESPIRGKALPFFGYFFFLLVSVLVSWKTKYCPDCGSNQPETEMQAREKRRKKKKKIGKYRVIPLNWAKL